MFKTKFNKGCMLVMGGAKSGKSSLALKICDDLPFRRIFLATAQAFDKEMGDRIARHREERDKKWCTVEEPLDIAAKIRELDNNNTVILIDCLTLWLNNLFLKYETGNDESIYQSINELAGQLSNMQGAVVAVSNDVGMGIVPDNALGRRFRDAAGTMNQKIASVASKAVVIFAGLPLVLKDE
ncbi:Bifunctional adenosylcobalamin biosynthesis protein CobP [uncultured Desulfobacterium sp.]|uniref:Adenosylcobinamide kinase n=1 Tax=uncultured Desulfobacterium sp. TaxID=201089 RepID=A0A445MQK8_9BACT|nr:Bifunctional adenosylcobalamin biosynthesis protein CobP [uncultured Desulfobacterium sp.]